ncbi:unnamed protein product [Callosobruchus maculatus]|uniref:LIM zinc-binding domain-containing protein n=1 Tax=Callosobruchus maculatus TaxID=64391 RepID=A0A653BHP4_CALMS|nr:unnamed protein product [Callosobruchus maculatus]
MKRCARCQATILSSELVMRAKHLVFHVHCFSCEACNALLTKGDQFGMRDGSVLCRLHFEMPTFPAAAAPPPHHHYVPPPFGAGGEFRPAHPGSVVPPPEAVAKVPPFFNGAPATPRQKGRPRKRKPKDLEDLTSDYLDMQFGRSPGSGSGTGLHGSGGQRTKRMRTSFKHHQLRTMKSCGSRTREQNGGG